ncbi:hypothetical protein [Chitinilyticum piscinae]|uniref:Uncharacterized protein n=1 Tax=Chitinilyticum piscinae TaxID=2866724 RepID=A0A8J7FQH6_9NEIS|nr:hypothetical protein [Chitinilyticum piscinae]MBE9610424.1 hypothetical protein [Chitinilyticum piscinae]
MTISNYEYFYSPFEADGQLSDDEFSQLNTAARVYSQFFGSLPDAPPYSVSNMGAFMSVAEARNWAQKHLP